MFETRMVGNTKLTWVGRMDSNRCGHRNPIAKTTRRRLRARTMQKHARACGPRYEHVRGRLPQLRAPTYYYLVNDTRAFKSGKKGTLMTKRAPIARSPNRGGYHEDESLCVGRFVSPDLFARRAPAVRFDSSFRAVCRRICFARGNPYGSWVGDAGDPIWAALANASGGAAHAARITLLKHLERGRQFLRGYQGEGALLRERDSLLEI
jgi:hypothetical protein